MKYYRSTATIKVVIVFFLLWGFSASYAEILTAICEEPKGLVIYRKPDGSIEKAEDKISGARPSITWDTSEKIASIIMQHTDKLKKVIPETYKAFVLPISDNQISFITNPQNGINVYTLFLDKEYMFISYHSDLSYLAKGTAKGNIFYSKCGVSVKK